MLQRQGIHSKTGTTSARRVKEEPKKPEPKTKPIKKPLRKNLKEKNIDLLASKAKKEAKASAPMRPTYKGDKIFE